MPAAGVTVVFWAMSNRPTIIDPPTVDTDGAVIDVELLVLIAPECAMTGDDVSTFA